MIKGVGAVSAQQNVKVAIETVTLQKFYVKSLIPLSLTGRLKDYILHFLWGK